MDACERHQNCHKEGTTNVFFFSFALQKRLWKVPKADNAASVCRDGDGPDRQTALEKPEAGKLIPALTETPGKVPRQEVTSQRRTQISCKPESRQKRDYPRVTMRTVAITRGASFPPTALKGSCVGGNTPRCGTVRHRAPRGKGTAEVTAQEASGSPQGCSSQQTWSCCWLILNKFNFK